MVQPFGSQLRLVMFLRFGPNLGSGKSPDIQLRSYMRIL